ncbi:hypothetical protein BJ085DRAFT_39681 [Dimargaris cristalligena]|uniref:Uncharacterized protein n=1 Tax=Dimargaris cristalligena TaxID=215637 RepID=A0A4P9ZL79_9FUNG|nr:hypothetical protein BJ085DRAFT_39681 [Dimargaris cristalligena]|eukprot:RKP33883.1 hypothetical protein BJ085DRAFT_39681 [Dimargaris cristalligena]
MHSASFIKAFIVAAMVLSAVAQANQSNTSVLPEGSSLMRRGIGEGQYLVRRAKKNKGSKSKNAETAAPLNRRDIGEDQFLVRRAKKNKGNKSGKSAELPPAPTA